MKKQKQKPCPPIALQILAIIGCGSGEITLSSCLNGCTVECSLYDEICCPDSDRGCDLDHDEYTTRQGDADCDGDPEINPDVTETCDLLDNNCDRKVDEDVQVPFLPDADGDGYYGTTDGSPLFFCAGTLVEGYSTIDGDCNDLEPSIYPGAPELCDGRDNDGDGQADTEDSRHYFRDQDGDGFGVLEDAEYPTSVACAESLEYVPARGDCNDADSNIHPGADDPSSDGIDQDCGLHDGPDAHVGFVTSDYGSLQDALTAAADGTRVWIDAGTYLEPDLSWTGKTLELWSTELAEATVIDAGGAGGGLVLDSLPGINVVDGVEVTNAAGSGAAIYLNQCQVELRGRIVQHGATRAILVENSTSLIENCIISQNTLTQNGGVVDIRSSDVTIFSSKIADNSLDAYSGSALIIGESDSESIVTITQSIISSNIENSGSGWAAAGVINAAKFNMENCTIVSNVGAYIGGIYFVNVPDLFVEHNIIAYNSAFNLRFADADSAEVQNNLIYSPFEKNSAYGKVLETSNIFEDPTFLIFSDDLLSSNDDLHLSSTSPARPINTDSGEWGAYAWSGNECNYYMDGDQDGMFDGWEASQGLSTTANDAQLDADEDGLSNVDEFTLTSLLLDWDTDQDNFGDGEEIAAGTDPRDWYSQLGMDSYPELATVPGDFLSIQEAITSISLKGIIVVESGDYQEFLLSFDRDVTLLPLAPNEMPTISCPEIAEASVIRAYGGAFTASGFHLTGGVGLRCGGISLGDTTAVLSNMQIDKNQGTYGGGIALERSNAHISETVIDSNEAVIDKTGTLEGIGGGIYNWGSSLDLLTTVVSHNISPTYAGLYIGPIGPENVSLDQCLINHNRATSGVTSGLGLVCSMAIISNSTIANNIAASAGEINFTNTFCKNYPSPDDSIISNSVVAFNSPENVYDQGSLDSPLFTHSVLYNPEGYANYNIPDEDLDDTNLFVEPGFLTYADAEGNACTPGSSLECLPTDFHLALDSLLIDAGDPEELDPDGTISDIGAYGGIDADAWDLDGDGYSDYFWPGTITDAPEGFDPGDYDCDDLDPDVQGCW